MLVGQGPLIRGCDSLDCGFTGTSDEVMDKAVTGLLLSAVMLGIKSSCMDCGGLPVISQGHGVAGVRGCVVGEAEVCLWMVAGA